MSKENVQRKLVPFGPRTVITDYPSILEVYDENGDIIGRRLIYSVVLTEKATSQEVEVNIGDRNMYLRPKSPIILDKVSNTVQVELEKRRYVVRKIKQTDPEWVQEAVEDYLARRER